MENISFFGLLCVTSGSNAATWRAELSKNL